MDIDKDRAGQRIDNFLFGLLKGVPKQHIYRIIRRGEVRVNSKRISPFYRLTAGDKIRIPPVRTAKPSVALLPDHFDQAQLDSRIIYEDNSMLAINKPAGMPVHGGTGQQCGLIEAVRLLRSESRFLELVHRLDLETSGCLLIAKKRSALRVLHAHFRENRVFKSYQALLAGKLQKQKQFVDAPIRKERNADGSRKIFVGENGKQAMTEIRCIRHWDQYTHVECRPRSGRTHQIRVHAQFIGHPIIGDQRYGVANVNKIASAYGLKRLFLHATSLRFPHPETSEIITLESALETDLVEYLLTLGV
ncbi:MAG: RluA family pseudouridine synthase [Methylococcales bacterium]